MTRQNRYGHPCPPWCTTDHDHEVTPGSFANVHSSARLRSGVGEYGYAFVSACLMPSDGATEIHVSTVATPLFVPVAYAERLACLAELLADASPEQHREIAAAIRKAAAETVAKEEEPHGQPAATA